MRATLQKAGTVGLLAVLLVSTVVLFRLGILPALRTTQGDFGNYYTASRLVAEGISFERAYRDFVWFQKQMDRVGIQNQVGGFIPHPPPTALIFLPLQSFDALTAKRIWIWFNVILLALNIYLLTKISEMHWLITAVLVLGTGYGLLNNFLFGQQYLLVLASILLAILLRQRGYHLTAGVALGFMIPVKYVGVLFLLYFAWKKNWRLVLAAIATSAGIVLLTLWLTDLQTFITFGREVLPRHLRGEIQEPFAVYFQSWNSLFRRLFVYEQTLNPNPAVNAPAAFFMLKSFVFLLIVSLSLFVLNRLKLTNPRHQSLFELGWIPVVILLISPGSATYHFLLLAISAVFFIKILIDLERPGAAFLLAALFMIVNLPHFMKTTRFASGWMNLLAYPRLATLLTFFLATIFLFNRYINWRMNRTLGIGVAVLSLFFVGSTVLRARAVDEKEKTDAAKWLQVSSPEFDRHIGLILKSPAVGTARLVFDYCELLTNDYAVYAENGELVLRGQNRNFYDPALAPDDATLLVETVSKGRTEIWLSRDGQAQPHFWVTGSEPAWDPQGGQFAYVRRDTIALANLRKKITFVLSDTGEVRSPAFSENGHFLAYCVDRPGEWLLRLHDLRTGETESLLTSSSRIKSPTWADEDGRLVFCWELSGNRDIWEIDINSRRTTQMTFNRAADDEPVWDRVNERVVFTSDRGRGLECSTLYWLDRPKAWQ